MTESLVAIARRQEYEARMSAEREHSMKISDNLTSAEVFVARQPIFDRNREVLGYELLFRSSTDNKFDGTEANSATSQVISNALHSIGLERLTRDKLLFINMTRDLIVNEAYAVLPPDRTVIEVLEDTLRDAGTLEACAKLKQAGYQLAMDDVMRVEDVGGLMDMIDYIKVDWPLLTKEQRGNVIRQFIDAGQRVLAEKVESQADLEEAMSLGCEYFQGYFFASPEVVSGRKLNSIDMVHLQFLQELGKPELDYDRIEELIKQDMSLSFNFLKYINSAAMGIRHEVTSIKQGLSLLGERYVRRWGTLVAVTSLNRQEPTELVLTSLVRARFCESMGKGEALADKELDLFLVGLFSAIHRILGVPMNEVLEQIRVPGEVADVLLAKSTAPQVMRTLYELTLACEQADWASVIDKSIRLQQSQSEIAMLYYYAMNWANALHIAS